MISLGERRAGMKLQSLFPLRGLVLNSISNVYGGYTFFLFTKAYFKAFFTGSLFEASFESVVWLFVTLNYNK